LAKKADFLNPNVDRLKHLRFLRSTDVFVWLLIDRHRPPFSRSIVHSLLFYNY